MLEVNEEKSWHRVSARILSGGCVLSLPLQGPLLPAQGEDKSSMWGQGEDRESLL